MNGPTQSRLKRFLSVTSVEKQPQNIYHNVSVDPSSSRCSCAVTHSNTSTHSKWCLCQKLPFCPPLDHLLRSHETKLEAFAIE